MASGAVEQLTATLLSDGGAALINVAYALFYFLAGVVGLAALAGLAYLVPGLTASDPISPDAEKRVAHAARSTLNVLVVAAWSMFATLAAMLGWAWSWITDHWEIAIVALPLWGGGAGG